MRHLLAVISLVPTVASAQAQAQAQTVSAPKPGVQVAFLVAMVNDSALGEIGLVGSGVAGLAVPGDRESVAMQSFRLLTLQERKLARVLATPAMLVNAGTEARLDVEHVGSIRLSTRTAAGTTMLDVAVEAPTWLKAPVVRGTAPLGTWALLGRSTKRGQTFVVLVGARDEPEPPAATTTPASVDEAPAMRGGGGSLGR